VPQALEGEDEADRGRSEQHCQSDEGDIHLNRPRGTGRMKPASIRARACHERR